MPVLWLPRGSREGAGSGDATPQGLVLCKKGAAAGRSVCKQERKAMIKGSTDRDQWQYK
jgi:hypothetical protein